VRQSFVGRRTERLEALKTALSEAYPCLFEVCCVTFDVQEIARIAELPTELPESHRFVDLLVNNAGLALGVAGVAENDMVQVRQMMDTNVTAVIAFARAFILGMRSRGRGHLINIGSIAATRATRGALFTARPSSRFTKTTRQRAPNTCKSQIWSCW
jgi:NADP-dependent 3-hydroxy acid dehydrogenase YdfG